MTSKELIINHYPTHCDFTFEDNPIVLNRKTYHKHIFKYHKVTLVTSYEDFIYIPIRNLLLIKLFSRDKTLIHNALGEERSVTILFIINFIYKYLLRMVYKSDPDKKNTSFKDKLNKFFPFYLPERWKKSIAILKHIFIVKLYFSITYWYFDKKGMTPHINDFAQSDASDIEKYWGEHTVNSIPYLTSSQSQKNVEMRTTMYPLKKEYMQLYGDHQNQIVMDYGCGPGNDVTGFALFSNAKKIIGVDISMKALQLTQHRLALHRIHHDRLELIHISDKSSSIPVEDNSVDYINSEGVLHHTSHPDLIIQEFHRILKPQSQACIMVYNYDSLWLHIHAAYLLRIQMGRFPGMSAFEVFSKCVDGEDCPKALCYRGDEFISLCKKAGFDNVEYLGGFFSDVELEYVTKYTDAAIEEKKLEDEHKDFLRKLEFTKEGYPLYEGKTTGFGGVYYLYKQ